MAEEPADKLEYLWNIQRFCIDEVAQAGRLVIFMKGSPLQPVDYYGTTAMLLLQAMGVDIYRIQQLSLEELQHITTSKKEMYYVNIYGNGEDVRELFRPRFFQGAVVSTKMLFCGFVLKSMYAFLFGRERH